MTSKEDVNFDSVFNALGWNGRYQVVQVGLVLLSSLPFAFHVMSIIFIGCHVPSRCKELNDSSVLEGLVLQADVSDLNITYHECGISITSNMTDRVDRIGLSCIEGYQYEKPRELSLVSEWDIVCEKEGLSDLLQTLYMFGMGIGAVVFTVVADRFGRKFSNVLAGLSFFVVGTGMAFIPTFVPFAVLRVLQGATQMGVSLTSTTLYLEIVPTRHRSKMSVLATIVWSASIVIYAVAAYLMKDLSWRYHQLVVGLTSTYYIVVPWVLDESYRWLAANNMYDVIERNLKKASRMNSKNANVVITTFRDQVLSPRLHDHLPLLTHSSNGERACCRHSKNVLSKQHKTEEKPFLQIFKDGQILTVSAIIWFIWLTDCLTYYGLQLNSTKFHSDKYIGFGLSAITDLLASIMFWLTVDRFGRRRTCLVFHLIAGLSLIASVIFNNYKDKIPSFSVAVTTFSLIGKFAIATTFNLLWLYTPEIFPTKIRSVGFGLASLAARIGGLLAPFSRTLYRHYPWAPGSVFGSCCIVVTFLMRYLPETNNQELPQTIREMKQWMRQQRETPKKKQNNIISET